MRSVRSVVDCINSMSSTERRSVDIRSSIDAKHIVKKSRRAQSYAAKRRRRNLMARRSRHINRLRSAQKTCR